MIEELAEFALAVRESSLKRLRQVPIGAENWRIDSQAMSFADVAQHLIDADDWLFKILEDREIEPMVGRAHLLDVSNRAEYDAALQRLEEIGLRRAALVKRLSSRELLAPISDARFGGKVSVWWVIVRGNLDHEIHHRGQIVAYLRSLRSGRFKTDRAG